MRCRRWRGVCVEANPNHIAPFMYHRPEDLILNMGVGVSTGFMDFYMIDDYSGRNTFSKDVAEMFVSEYPHFHISKVTPIKVVKIDELFEKFGVPDLLSIDIEGLDYEVLDTMRGRSKVICVENHDQEWYFDSLLSEMGYGKIFNTVANGIYLHE